MRNHQVRRRLEGGYVLEEDADRIKIEDHAGWIEVEMG